MSEETTDPVVAVPEALWEPLRKLRHDLRTPLNHIIGLSDLWADQPCDDPAHAELNNDLQKIRDAAWRLNDMLDLLITEEGFHIPPEATR